jgi:hypothetical protein
MVSASLVWLCLACRDDPNCIASQCVGVDQQAALYHAKKDQAGLAVIFTVVYEVYGEWIIEGLASLLETHAVFGEIGSSLCIIPFEVDRAHDITGYP